MPDAPLLIITNGAADGLPRPWHTAAALTWGDHLPLIQRCVRSLQATLPGPPRSELIVAANAPAPATREWLEQETAAGGIQRLLLSEANLFKSPMLGHVIRVARGDSLWWFDDDSHVTDPGAFERWNRQAESSSPTVVGWGATAYAHWLDGFPSVERAAQWVRQAPWFQGHPPPGEPGGPREWWFLTGGCWWMRLSALRAMGWPDPCVPHVSEDILLGEAIRQHGWHIANVDRPGVAISDAPRRGDVSSAKPLWRS